MLSIKRHLALLSFLALLANANGQTIEEAYTMFGRRQFDSSFVAATKIIERDNSNPQAYEIAGRSLYRRANFSEAIGFLEKVKTFQNAPLFTKAWAMHDLAVSYYSFARYDKAKENLLGSLALKATRNVSAEASNSLLWLGLDTFYTTWTTMESKHFIFHFQDTTSVWNISSYIIQKEKAFDFINSFFKANLPKKIDYFVWKDAAQAQTLLKRPLAFTEPPICLTHTGLKNTVGHEMTHTISYFAAKPAKKSRLISEGVCVYFDLTKKNNLNELKTMNLPATPVKDIWSGRSPANDDILYPLGGELVKRLIEAFGGEIFKELLSDQSYERARVLYGDRLDVLISKLEEDLRH